MVVSDLLAEPAQRYANGTAFYYGHLRVSFRRFRDDVETVAAHLYEAGIRPGDLVGLHIPRTGPHWVAVLALMRLGAVSASLTRRHEAELAALPDLSVLLHLAGEVPPGTVGRRIIAIDPAWLQEGNRPSATLPSLEEAQQLVGRIAFTSGTTGVPKAILLDATTLTRRLSGTAGRTRLHSRSVLWCGLGPDTAYGFTAPLAAWACGAGVCLVANHDDAFRELSRSDVNVVVASPIALEAVLRTMPSSPLRRFDGPAIVVGGRLSAKLRDTLLRRFCSEVVIAYGSSETGGVATGDASLLDRSPGAVGQVDADVRVETVDGHGVPTPLGNPGRVRIATNNAVAEYFGDADGTAAHFTDGWFYPGDIGMISSDGVLTILGRSAEVLNVGGAKISPDEIDSFVVAQDGIEDACAFVITLPDGSRRLGIAIVGEAKAVRRVPAAIRASLPSLPRLSFVPVSAIPRSAAGKVNRDEFGRLIADRLVNPASRQPSDGFAFVDLTETADTDESIPKGQGAGPPRP